MNSSQIVMLILNIGLFAFAFFKFYQYFSFKRKQQASLNWPEASASVSSSRTDYTRSSKGNKRYHAEIEYTYTVLGAVQTGHQRLYSFFGGQNSADKDAAKYPVGSTFPLRYNPEKPGDNLSALDKSASSNLTSGILFLFLGLLTAYFFFLN